ncbi:alpha/beta fold hydrolase [Amaricoccus solimangrovi]|uniref:Alpha/beta fold hydrolase n=1 Tax=Amaricoccus solimangrovi TaxID=2589815 RepID=A0A501WLN4_9RHOB|nr:alpha/beta fold hydrolase [Amaricoccus solimangrovi]TPE50258.1 alpha/beta fold hydrolase [Amaricoccus solimangrovi]
MALALNTIVTGEPTARPPLVIAHGLFGSARNWGMIAKRLSAGRQVISVDMRNHGDSPWDAEHSYPAMAADLARVIEEHGGRAAVMGHSMGGKAAMVLALTRPELVERLVVVDIAPVAYDHDQDSNIAAMRAVDLSGVARRSDADAALAAHVADPGLRGFFLQNLRLSPEGAAWRLNLDALSDQMPVILGFPEIRARYDGPALFVTGETSGYARPRDWPRVTALFPAARHAAIPGAGHWVHAEAPEAFLDAVAPFLA